MISTLLSVIVVLLLVLLWRVEHHARPATLAMPPATAIDAARLAWAQVGLNLDDFSLDANIKASGKFADWLHFLTLRTGHDLTTVRHVLAILIDDV